MVKIIQQYARALLFLKLLNQYLNLWKLLFNRITFKEGIKKKNKCAYHQLLNTIYVIIE